MDFEVGDIVSTEPYTHSVLFKLVCFVDRDGPKCVSCQNTGPSPACLDDVHLEVIWKFHEATVSWKVGESLVTSARSMMEPTANEMLVLALAAL